MEIVPEFSALTELVVALEQATLMAKQLPNTTNPSQTIQIYATLHSAHHHLSSFLSQSAHQPYPPPQPSLPLPLPPPASAAENSLSSAAGNGDGDEPMQDDDDEGTTTIERVEERMRDCFIQNKRTKRPLSPVSAAAGERRRSYELELLRDPSAGFDPQGTRLRALDLIYQFHG